MILRALLTLTLLATLAAPTWAQPVAKSELDAARGALVVGYVSEAHERASQLVARAPRDAEVLLLVAQTALATGRFQLAEQYVATGLAEDRGHAGLLALRASLLLDGGDDAAARDVAERALRINKNNETARNVLDEIELAERARKRVPVWESSALPSGSAERFVDWRIEYIAAGADGGRLADWFDPQLLPSDQYPEWSRTALIQMLDGLLEAERADAAAGRSTYLGWETQPGTRQEGDETWVRVLVVTELVFTEEDRRALEAALPAQPVPVRGGASLADQIAGLPLDERPAVLASWVGRRTRSVETAEVALRREESINPVNPVWRISNFRYRDDFRDVARALHGDAVAWKETLRTAAYAPTFPDASKPAAVEASTSANRGWLWLLLAVVGGVAGLFLIRYLSARRGPGPGNLRS